MRDFLKHGQNLLLRKQSSILSAAFVIMVTYGLSHILGLVKSRLLISYFFGNNAGLLDVYYAAMVIPDTIFQLLVMGSLSAAFIPIFSKYLAKSESSAWEMASVTINTMLLVFSVLCLVIFLAAKPLVGLVAPGFSTSQMAIMVNLLRVMLASQLFFCISGFLTGMIQSHQRFLLPAIAPLVYNAGIILGIVLFSSSLGIYAPAIGMVMGSFLHMLIQLPAAMQLGFRFTASLDFKHPAVLEVGRLMPPRVLAMGVDQVEQFVAVILASSLVPGSLSLFNAARLLYAVPTLLVGATIGQAALPTLSALVAKQDFSGFRKTLLDTVLQVVFLALPICILFIVLRIPIVRLAFGAKTFPWEATLLTGKTLAILMVSAGFYALMQLVVRAFYALHDTKTPLLVGIVSAVFNTVLGIVAVKMLNWGVAGIAASLSITAIFETIILGSLLLRRRFQRTEIIYSVKSLTKLTVIGLLTGVGLWAPMRFLDQFIFDTTRTLPLLGLTLLTSVTGLCLYLILSYIFKVEQLYTAINLVGRMSQWRINLKEPAQSEPIIVPAPDQN